MDKIYYTEEIKRDLELFQREFIEEHRDRLTSLFLQQKGYIPEGLVGGLFRDCGHRLEADQDSEWVYTEYYKNRDVIPIQGVPQVTIGTSYAFFLPILFSSGDEDIELFNIIFGQLMKEITFDDLSIEEFMVIEGFFATLVYSCIKHSTYLSPSIVKSIYPYFKASFNVKPRSNPASSYRQLIQVYPKLEEYIQKLYQVLSSSIEDSVSSYNELISYKNSFIRSIYGKTIKEKLPAFIKYSYLMSVLSSEVNVVFDMVCIDLKYVIEQILKPRRVIQIRKLNVEYIEKGSPILENYFYRYTPEDEQKLSGHPAILDYRVLLEGYAWVEDLPILEITEEGKLSTNSRLEVFEWIADTPSLIFEIRNAETFADEEKYLGNVTIDNLDVFVEDFLSKIVKIMRVSLIKQGILEKPKRVSSSVSSLLM
jgi:hypothetical protein